MRTFIENYLHFMINCIRPLYEKLKPLKSGFIENSNVEKKRDPCTQVFLLMFFFQQGTNDIYFYNLNFNPVLNIMFHAKTDLLEHLKITFSIIVW